jgi:TPR repeat protein
VHLGGTLVDDPDTFAEAESWLRRAAEAGSHAGKYHLARFLLFTSRPDEADAWFEAVFAQVPALVTSLISELYERHADDLAREWREKAASRGWLTESAADDDAVAAARQGLHLAGERRFEEALPLLEQAAAAGIDAVRAALAGIYISENRVEDAFLSLQRAAAAGDAESPYQFASVMRERGDQDGAMRALEIAAGAGHATALLELGTAQSGRGDVAAAKETFMAAARGGDGRAAHKLALLYDEEGDAERAMAWYERAAGQGEISSMYNLGLLLSDRDPIGAEGWLRRAADDGHAAAPYALAVNALNAGRAADGEAWLRVGAERGDARAANALAQITSVPPREGGQRRRWRRGTG